MFYQTHWDSPGGEISWHSGGVGSSQTMAREQVLMAISSDGKGSGGSGLPCGCVSPLGGNEQWVATVGMQTLLGGDS